MKTTKKITRKARAIRKAMERNPAGRVGLMVYVAAYYVADLFLGSDNYSAGTYYPDWPSKKKPRKKQK